MHRGDTGKSGGLGIRSGHLMRRYEQEEREEGEEEMEEVVGGGYDRES